MSLLFIYLIALRIQFLLNARNLEQSYFPNSFPAILDVKLSIFSPAVWCSYSRMPLTFGDFIPHLPQDRLLSHYLDQGTLKRLGNARDPFH